MLSDSNAIAGAAPREDLQLCRLVSRDGITVEILIYRGKDDSGWMLEAVDQEGGSTVWDDLFPTDQEALAEAMNTIETFVIQQTAFSDCRHGSVFWPQKVRLRFWKQVTTPLKGVD